MPLTLKHPKGFFKRESSTLKCERHRLLRRRTNVKLPSRQAILHEAKL